MLQVKGTGILPSCMDPITVNADMKSASVHIINFVNPLQFAVHVSVLLSGRDSERFFMLHKKANNIFLQRGHSVDIPIMFAPEEMYKHEITATIVANSRYNDGNASPSQMEQSLHWKYPIFGQPVLRLCSNDEAPKIICHAKEQLEQMILVTLVKSLKSKGSVFVHQPGEKFSD